MSAILYAILMSVIWIVNLFNGTGLGDAYHITEYARIVTYLITIILVIKELRESRKSYIDREIVYSFGAVVLLFVCVSWYNGYGFSALEYLWAYLLIYIVGKIPVSEKAIKLTGILFFIMGLLIVYIFDYGSALSGWNSNSIAMIGLYSFLIFMIPFSGTNRISSKLLLVITGIILSILLNATDSRSCISFTILSLLFAINFLSGKKLTNNRTKIILFLLIPLLVAIITIWISGTKLIYSLNNWSLEEYNKSIFNGRDTIWIQGFETLKQNVLFGTGLIQSGLWHNCAIACLTSYGILGYFFWNCSFYFILKKSTQYLNDSIVVSCAVSFLILLAQQSVELGIFAKNPNLLPYLILGILIGRIRYIREKSLV